MQEPPPAPSTCTPAPCPAERPWPSVAHWLRPCSATLPGPADAGPGLGPAVLSSDPAPRQPCVCAWRDQDERGAECQAQNWPCSLEAAGTRVGVRVGWILPGHRLRALAGLHPSCLPHFTPQVGCLEPSSCEKRRPVLQLAGQGVGTGLQLPAGQTCRTCRTLLRSVGLTGPQQQQEQSHGWHLPHGLGLAGVPAGQGDSGGRSRKCSSTTFGGSMKWVICCR